MTSVRIIVYVKGLDAEQVQRKVEAWCEHGTMKESLEDALGAEAEVVKVQVG